MDVIVIGAGVIGAACAWRLAQTGMRVTVLERSAPCSGSSQAALGVLSFHASPEKHPSLNQLHIQSLPRYARTIDELEADTGDDLCYRQGGQLLVAMSEKQASNIDSVLSLNQDLDVEVERLSQPECLLLEPGVTPRVLMGIFFPADAWLDNTAFTLSMVKAAERAGAVFEQAEVSEVIIRDGLATGVQCSDRPIDAEWIVLAAGCWSGEIKGLPPVPVRPVRGQALSVEGKLVRRIVHSESGYLVPKLDSQTMVGATVEEAGFELSPTLGGLSEVSQAGLEIAPSLARSTYVGAWAGLRPGSADEIPLIGPFKQVPNVVTATGHFRNGILLAPITAEMVVAHITGQELNLDLEAFSPDRESLLRSR